MLPHMCEHEPRALLHRSWFEGRLGYGPCQRSSVARGNDERPAIAAEVDAAARIRRDDGQAGKSRLKHGDRQAFRMRRMHQKIGGGHRQGDFVWWTNAKPDRVRATAESFAQRTVTERDPDNSDTLLLGQRLAQFDG